MINNVILNTSTKHDMIVPDNNVHSGTHEPSRELVINFTATVSTSSKEPH